MWEDAIHKAVHAVSWLDTAHVPVFWDKESFHNWEKNSFFGGNTTVNVNSSRPGAKNCLFADGHVADLPH
jgi:prepilin-type processing-associated H-X9-DG protein